MFSQDHTVIRNKSSKQPLNLRHTVERGLWLETRGTWQHPLFGPTQAHYKTGYFSQVVLPTNPMPKMYFN